MASNVINAIGSHKYHNFECCEWTRGVDTLLARYTQDRNEVIALLEQDPDKLINTIWQHEGPLAIDNECRCNMGAGNKYSPFKCAQCKNIGRLIDFHKGAIEHPFRIQYGEYIGQQLVVLKEAVPYPFLHWDDIAVNRAQSYLQKYQNLLSCGTPSLHNLRCLTGDNFTVRTLLQWMLSKRFSEHNLPHIPTLYTAFICDGVGYSLSTAPKIGSFAELTRMTLYCKDTYLKAEIVRAIIMQLLVTFLELAAINFSHGTPSINALLFTPEPISYAYDGVHVHAPITLQLSNFSNASATFNDTHLFPKNVKTSLYIENNTFIPEIMSKTITQCTSEQIPVCGSTSAIFYRLTQNTFDIYNAMRHIGFPLYPGSFDFYCFMVSLMCEPAFFNAVSNDTNLYYLWSAMWLPTDYIKIEQYIREAHELPQKGNVAIDIIRGAWLRCDCVKYIWSLIKAGY